MPAIKLGFESFNLTNSEVPLIILHGFFASARNWRSLAKHFSEQRPVYVLDLRNHGGSPHHPLMDYPELAEDVLAFLDQHLIDQADFLGHSMGGKVAMWLALHHAERVRHLIIADISPVSYTHCFDNTIASLRALELVNLNNRKQAEEDLAETIPDLSYRQFLLQNLLLEQGEYRWRVNLDYFQSNAANIVAFPDVSNTSSYQKPVLFLSGEQSYYIRPEAIYPLFPHAKIIELAGTSHWLHIDAPGEFIRLTEHWLNH